MAEAARPQPEPDDGREAAPPRQRVLGIMADVGAPERIARFIADRLATALERRDAAVTGSGSRQDAAGRRMPTSDGGQHEAPWRVDVVRETLPYTDEGIPLLARSRQLRERHGWDRLLYLSDLPRTIDDAPLLAEVSPDGQAGMISVPVLGAVRVRHRALRVALALMDTMDDEQRRPVPPHPGRPAPSVVSGGEDDRRHVLLPGFAGRLRMLVGMIRSNRPGRLLSALSNAVVAALATGAFGIFYTSLWQISDALSPMRLLAVSLLSVVALTSWLIGRNGLWNRSRSAPAPRQSRRDNLSTAITVSISAAMAYLLLMTVLFIAAIVVISGPFLESQLEHDVSIVDYLQLSWLAASMGTFAGALGSNFDSDESIREATYSLREQSRRKLGEEQAAADGED